MTKVQDLDLEQLHNSIDPQQSDLGMSRHNPLSNSAAKQYLCAIGYLQLMQHHLLYGDMREAKLSSLSLLTTDARNRRRAESQRKNLSFTDAAKHAPELVDETQEHACLDNLLRQQGKQKQFSGIRTASMSLLNQRTAQRGQQIRDIRMCQRLNFVVPAPDDGASSMQPMELLGFHQGHWENLFWRLQIHSNCCATQRCKYALLLAGFHCIHRLLLNALCVMHPSNSQSSAKNRSSAVNMCKCTCKHKFWNSVVLTCTATQGCE